MMNMRSFGAALVFCQLLRDRDFSFIAEEPREGGKLPVLGSYKVYAYNRSMQRLHLLVEGDFAEM